MNFTAIAELFKFTKEVGQMWDWFKGVWIGKRKIYVFGNSGSGKSQFVDAMKANIRSTPPERTMVPDKTNLKIEDFPLQLIDTPGHMEGKSFRRTELDNLLKQNGEGIIHFVTFGYDETPGADQGLAYDSTGVIKEAFLEANRVQERERIREWVDKITDNTVKWAVILVNKADIWWEDKAKVNQYYHKLASEMIPEKYVSKVVVIEYCGIIQPFFGVQTSGKFGEIDKMKLHKSFITTLLSLMGKVNS